MSNTVPIYRLYGEETSQQTEFWLHFEELPVRSRPHRWEIDRHRHGAFFQIFNIAKGGGELLGEDGSERFEAPAAIIIPTGAIHGFRFAHESDGTVLTVAADRLSAIATTDRRFAGFFSRPRIVRLDGTAEEAIRAGEAVRRIVAELAGRRAGRMALVSALLTDAVVNLARTGIRADPTWNGPDDRDGRRLEQLADLLDIHFREHRPVGFYAGRIGISETHLNRLSRARLGTSVRRIIDGKLVSEARRELLFTPFSAKAVAFSLGFSDPAYFNRFFRRHTGTTPARFRSIERQKPGG